MRLIQLANMADKFIAEIKYTIVKYATDVS
jgi:hypothetical protein